MMKKLKIIDLFSGVGGLSYGFSINGNFDIVAANEILPDMAKAYSINHPSVKMYAEDILFFNAQRLQKDLGIDPKQIDIIVGGPPCQAYSTVGKRLIDDPRGKLFQEYYRILKEFDPSFFIFENVKGLMSMAGGELLKTIVSLFESLNYHVNVKLLNAANYGTPQIRERVIIVGSKDRKDFVYPKFTHINSEEYDLFNAECKKFLTLGEAISDLPLIEVNEISEKYKTEPQNEFQKQMRIKSNSHLTEHFSPKNGQNLIRLMKALPEGGSPKDLPENLRPTSGFPNTYSRLWWDRPSTTITRNFSTPSSSRCIHPKCARPLTIREAARLQSFPDHFKFFGTLTSKRLQIGNAVPPILSSILAKSVLKHFNKN